MYVQLALTCICALLTSPIINAPVPAKHRPAVTLYSYLWLLFRRTGKRHWAVCPQLMVRVRSRPFESLHFNYRPSTTRIPDSHQSLRLRQRRSRRRLRRNRSRRTLRRTDSCRCITRLGTAYRWR